MTEITAAVEQLLPATITVMARANLSIQGRTIVVFESVTLENTPEVRACISQWLLVPQNEDGSFPDLGPVDKPPARPVRCCGG